MYSSNNLGNTKDSNDSNLEHPVKPALNKLNNKRKKTISDLQLSFELFRRKLNESERNSNMMAVEDNMNMGLSCQSNEKLHQHAEPVKKVSNDIKLIWLQSALSFIKNDHHTTLKFPTISVDETDFIQAILNKDCEPDFDGRFSALYLSIKEALTIYKTKYVFALNTIFKSEKTIKLELEKIPKNNKLKFAKMSEKNTEVKMSGKKVKKNRKLITDKMGILNAVPMHYIISCYKQILNFLDDDLRFTITFDKLQRYEYEFIMNVKQIVKSREVLEDELQEELNTLLERISTHKDYAFSLIPNTAKYEEKSVVVMKVPKEGVRGNFQPMEDSLNISHEYQNFLKTKDLEPNNNKILYRKIDNTIKNTNASNTSNLNHDCPEEKRIGIEFNNNIFKSNNLYTTNTESSPADLKEMQCNSWENIDISHWRQSTAADSLTIYNEKKLANQAKSIQFQRGGSVDELNEEHSTNMKKLKNVRCRSWSRGRDVNKMKSKMYEALLVPLKSTKAIRMMQLMGWKGGALGSRGEGITEPIMPAIGIQPGAGLGHCRNNFKTNVIPKKDPQPDPIVQPDKMANKDKPVDTRFVICSIDRFNRRKYVRNLKSQCGAEDLRKVQEAMLAKPHVNLAAVISDDKKDIVLTKTFKGENNNERALDFSIDSNDSIRLNISVYRYIKTMKPKEFYGIFTKPSYQLLGFKLTMLEQILIFLDIKESTLMLYVDINLHDKYTEFLQNFIDVINMGCKPRYATEAEELLVEKIHNKIGDYCLILDYFRPLKIIKLQKKNRNTQDSGVRELKNNQQETKELKQNSVKDVLKEKQINDNLYQINSSLEFNIEKTVEKITTNVMNNLTQIYGKGVNNTVFQDTLLQGNKQIVKETITNKDEKNTDIITIDLTEENVQTEEEIQNNLKQKQTEENLEDYIENERKDINENKNKEAIEENQEKQCFTESEDILKIIDDLEQFIKIEEKPLNEEHNQKRNRSDSNDSQLQNTKKIKRHAIKCYKQIEITPNNSIETMNNNLAGIVQSLISNAIDRADCLPLLQCIGIVNEKLLYICYNENSYKWLKTVLNDQFEVLDAEVNLEGRRKLKINLKTYIYDDTSKILNRLKMYNSYLDVDSWKIHKTFVSVDETFLWVEVDEEDYNVISRNDFSLFAGIDKATFSVVWE
ncbi:hypothetical protein RR48_10059 [Papilio machaon]|uniref:G-patch domain-containing protein n=1 Tax=Papilio machaon TaxID=76193 RepID=A0A194R018_PAPMA|nr:hypothetical protein RR48_10059 [Papilio machaon]